MKKLAFAAVVLATALTTQAASVAWKSSALSFGSTALKSDTAVTGYLVLLSGSSLASPYTFNETFDASVVGSVVNSDTDGTSKGSLVNGTLDLTGASNGQTYALLTKYVNDGKTYWNLSSTLNTLSGLDPTDPRVNPEAWTNFAFGSTVVGESETLTAGGGWTLAKQQTEPTPPTPDVPEPATGALALAGVALLFKRRRA